VLGASLVITLAGCGNSSAPITASPRTLVLTLLQLPYAGFTIENGSKSTGFISNKTAAGGQGAALRRFEAEDRKSAYLATFIREVSPQEVVGPVVIASSAVLYGSISGASSGFTAASKQLGQTGWQHVSTGPLGDQAAGFTESRMANQVDYQSFVIDWRQSNVVNQVRIAGNAATLDIGYALTLARIQQRSAAAS